MTLNKESTELKVGHWQIRLALKSMQLAPEHKPCQ